MKSVKSVRLALGLWFLSLFAVVAQAQENKREKRDAKEDGLVIAISDNGTGRRVDAIKPVAEYLSKELGVEVRTTVAKNSLDLLSKIKEGAVDIAYINGFGYVLGKTDSLALVPLVSPGNADGTPNTYNSCIFTAPNSGIKSLADLVARAADYSFLFVNPTSTSGHLVPRLYLTRMGLKQLEVDFKQVDFANNHYRAIEQVLAGGADAGAAAYNIIVSRIERGEMQKEAVNVLWVSEEITQEPVVVHESMDKRLQKKIRKALLNIHIKDPALWRHIQQNFSAKEAECYVPAKDENYNSIRTVSGKIEDLLFIMNFYAN